MGQTTNISEDKREEEEKEWGLWTIFCFAFLCLLLNLFFCFSGIDWRNPVVFTRKE